MPSNQQGCGRGLITVVAGAVIAASMPSPVYGLNSLNVRRLVEPTPSARSRCITALASGVVQYTTTFPLTENPMSESGIWLCGAAVGLDWTDPRTSGGVSYGTQNPGSSNTDDSIACIDATKLSFPANQQVDVTVVVDPALSTGQHEMECLLRFAISGHNARGYECNYSYGNGAGGPSYQQIVRWNGSLNSFDVLAQTFGAPAPVTGDTIRATIVGNLITVYLVHLGVQSFVQSVDITAFGGTVWASGQPGIGTWHGNNSSTDYVASDYFAQGL